MAGKESREEGEKGKVEERNVGQDERREGGRKRERERNGPL